MKKNYIKLLAVTAFFGFIGQSYAQEALPKCKRKKSKESAEVAETTPVQNSDSKLGERPAQTNGEDC